MSFKRLLYVFYFLLVINPSISYAQTPQQVAEYIATQANKYGVDPKLALYITWQESHWDCSQIGDQGSSFGCWQIHLPESKGLTKPEAQDLIISTDWSLKQLAQDHCVLWSTCPY